MIEHLRLMLRDWQACRRRTARLRNRIRCLRDEVASLERQRDTALECLDRLRLVAQVDTARSVAAIQGMAQ